MEQNELNTENKEGMLYESSSGRTPEDVLNTIAVWTLRIGLVFSALLIIGAFQNEHPRYHGGPIGPAGGSTIQEGYLITGICLFLSSIVTWGVLKVICNISNNLREINKKLK